MTATRRSIRAFALGIALSVASRLWATTSLPYRDAVFTGGLVLGTLAWMIGAYYGYRAVRGEGGT